MRRPRSRIAGWPGNTSGVAEDSSSVFLPYPFMTTITLHLTDYDGTARTLTAKTGQSLMKAAVAGGSDGIGADCGGSLTCATCHVIVADDWQARLPARSADEEAMLDMAAHPREPGSRLSCQITLTPELDGLAVRVAPTQY